MNITILFIIISLLCLVAYKIYYFLPQLHLFFTINRSYVNNLTLNNFSKKVVFVNVNVIPMDSERVIENQTVIIENSKIETIGNVDKVLLPDNASIIQCKGKYLIPGLTDMHSHLINENELILYIANGITTIRNMWGYKIFGRHLHLEIKDKVEKGLLLGPRIYTAGNFFDGKHPIWPLANKITSFEDAENAVSKEKENGYDFIKIYSLLEKENYDNVISAAQRYNIPAIGHVPSKVSIDHVLSRTQHTIEHLQGYIDMFGRQNCSISTNNYENYAKKTACKKIYNCPTIVANKYCCPESEEKNIVDESKLKYMSPYMKKYWKNYRKSQHRLIKKNNFQYPSTLNNCKIKMLSYLHKSNTKIILGTDSNMPYVYPGFSIHEELKYMISAGMTPYEALYTGTNAAAKCLNDIDNSGTITVGKRADLILLDKNPLIDINNLTKKVGIMVNGKWLSNSKLQNMLAGLVKSY